MHCNGNFGLLFSQMTAVLISWPFLALADPQTPFHYFYRGNEFYVSGRRPEWPRAFERPVHHQSEQHQERDQESDVQEREGQQGPADGHRPCRHPSTFTRGYQRQDCKVQKGHPGAFHKLCDKGYSFDPLMQTIKPINILKILILS